MDTNSDPHAHLIDRLHRIAKLRRAAVLKDDWPRAQELAIEFFNTLEQLIRLGQGARVESEFARDPLRPDTLH